MDIGRWWWCMIIEMDIGDGWNILWFYPLQTSAVIGHRLCPISPRSTKPGARRSKQFILQNVGSTSQRFKTQDSTSRASAIRCSQQVVSSLTSRSKVFKGASHHSDTDRQELVTSGRHNQRRAFPSSRDIRSLWYSQPKRSVCVWVLPKIWQKSSLSHKITFETLYATSAAALDGGVVSVLWLEVNTGRTHKLSRRNVETRWRFNLSRDVIPWAPWCLTTLSG